MPCHTRMKIILLKALLWLYLWGFSFTVASLEPGFLDFDNLPDTNFSCVGKVIGGYYADLETACQMFHVCTIGQLDEPMDIRFLCLNGTVFDQETRVCERIDEVDCSKSEKFYSLNLELYGNTQPPILEDNLDADPPDILKHSSTTTTTTTTPRPTKPKPTRPNFIITTTPKPPTTTLEEKFLQSHPFPGSNTADIRFNPEEINISLNPGAPPNIRSKPVSFQQSISDNNKRVIVTTHTTIYKNENNKPPSISTPEPQIVETQKPKTIVNYDLNHDTPHPQPHVQSAGEDNYNFDAYQTEKNLDYETEIPHHEISFRPSFRPSSRDIEHYTPKPEYKSSTYRTQYHTTTINPVRIGYSQRGPTTYRNSYSSPLKPALPYYHRTDKPPRIQLPLPLIPTLSPLTFSSPAPFSLSRHIESKRFTDHHQPPRIVISASASVSDASGRKFNYSLGTIGDSRFFGQAPHSYDDYKEDDVSLDPFYHDVPKLKRSRRRQKRSTSVERKQKNSQSQEEIKKKTQEHKTRSNNNKRIKRRPQDEIKSEKEAIDVLKFLFNWYNSHEKMSETQIPIDPETITEINKELSKINDEEYYYDDYDFTTKLELEKSTDRVAKVIKNHNVVQEATTTSNLNRDNYQPQYNISEGVISVTESQTEKSPKDVKETAQSQQVDRIDQIEYEYVDDNYEPQTYNHTNSTNPTKDYDHDYSIYNKESSKNNDQTQESITTLIVEEPTTRKNQKPNKKKNYGTKTRKNNNQNLESQNIRRYNSELNKNQNVDVDSDSIYNKESIKSTNENYESYVTESNINKNTGERQNTESNTEDFLDNKSYDTKLNNDYQNYDPESNTRKIDYVTKVGSNDDVKENIKNVDDQTYNIETNTGENNNDPESDIKISFKPESNTKNYQKHDPTIQVSTIEYQPYETDVINNKEETTYEQPTITENNIVSTTETTADITETLQYDKVLKILGITTSKPTQNVTSAEIQILTPDLTTVSYDQNTDAISTYNKVPTDVVDTTVLPNLTTVEVATTEDFLTITQQGITEQITTMLPTRKQGRNSRRNYGQNKRGKAKKYRKFVELKKDNINEEFPTTITTESYVSTTPTPTSSDITDFTTKLVELNEYDYGIYSKEYKQYDDIKPYQVETTISDDSQKTESTPIETTTNYDTTLNNFYTTIQLQDFIDKVESNTNSIADTKNLTDTTIEIATVNIENDPTTELQITTVENTTPTTTTKRYESRGGINYRRNRFRGVHRFSVGTTNKPRRRKPSITEEIVDVIKNRMDALDESSTRKTSRRKKIEFNINAYTANLAYRNRKDETTEEISIGEDRETTETLFASSTHKISSTTDNKPSANSQPIEDASVTAASFSKSANPTIAKNPKDLLPTTPVSKSRNNINYVFNCIGKAVNKFYSDPRDCRLFHYCTKGFTKTQLLDMKFVCDFGTYFDSEKLICTKDKPLRCV